MEGLISLIEELKADREVEKYDEASTRQSIILPVLEELGWRPRKRDEVYPEYSVGKGRVDYALRLHGENKIFIEVKKVSEDLDTERFQEQLLTYSFRLGVKMSILTNGLSWWFYLPLNEGNWEQRKFFSINMREQQTNDVVERFDQFLSRNNVSIGAAFKNAEAVYKSQKREKAIKEAIPKAWNKLLNDENEPLVELISETAEKICGYKPGNDTVLKFMRENKERITVEGPVHKPPTPKRSVDKPSPLGKQQNRPVERVVNREMLKLTLDELTQKELTNLKPASINIEEDVFQTRSWSDLCIKFVEWLIGNGRLTSQSIPIYNYARREKYFVNSKPEHANVGMHGEWKQVENFFVDVGYNTQSHVKNIIATLDQLGFKNLDVRITV